MVAFVNPLAGAGSTRRTTSQEFKLGTVAMGDNNKSYTYVQASEAVATGTCTVSAAWALTDAAGTYTNEAAFASGEYGWVYLTTSPFGA